MEKGTKVEQFEDEVSHPRELLRPCLLLLLAEGPGHGYDLMARLKPFGFDWGGPGPIYRELRALEEAGQVRSSWEAPGAGPARHVYELSPAGTARLDRCAAGLHRLIAILEEYHSRYQALAGTKVDDRPSATGAPAARPADPQPPSPEPAPQPPEDRPAEAQAPRDPVGPTGGSRRRFRRR